MLLSTAIVDLVSEEGKTRQGRLLLDNGSQSHYLTESVVSFLKLHKESVDISVSSLGTMHTFVRHSVSARIKSRYKKYEQYLNFLVVKELNYLVTPIIIDHTSFEIPKNIFLADPIFEKLSDIDGIIGVGIFFKLL